MKTFIVIFALILLILGLNQRQLYSVWTLQSETARLNRLALADSEESQNPLPIREYFNGKLSTDFWRFSTINGAGKVSNESVWHSAAWTMDPYLTIRHFPDPEFESENANPMSKPAAGQYNNVSLIGGSGFRPTPSADVVMRFSSRVGEDFYGSAGVIVQPMGTLQKDGMFVKPFNMFGFFVVGEDSTLNGINGSLCYLALKWVPARAQALSTDARVWHNYELRLHWISQTEWSGSVTVDDDVQCQINMPAFGPVEVHVWSDNVQVIERPRRWWEIASQMDLKFQNKGNKEFQLGMIEIFEEQR